MKILFSHSSDFKINNIVSKRLVAFFVFLVFIFTLKSVLFAANFGGIEHDSGWYLGVARNLAEKGKYASYVNTIAPEEEGVYPSLHGRYSVQDKDGLSYFPAGVTVGPGYVIPQALLLKIFGSGWWQYRLWPLITFAGLILLIFVLTYNLGGGMAFSLIAVWLWLTPQLTIQFSYEAFGEHIALFYLLLSFYLLFISERFKNKRLVLFAFSGFFFSLTVLTKYLFALSGAGLGIVFVISILKTRKRIREIQYWLVWLLFAILPVLAYEIYRYLYMNINFGNNGWDAINRDFIMHFKNNGSGTNLSNIDWVFIGKKLKFWENVGINPFPAWLLILFTPYFFLRNEVKKSTSLYLLLFFTFVASSLWFVILSPTGWTRHVWQGLVVGMMLIVVTIAKIWNFKRVRYLIFAVFVALLFADSPVILEEKFNATLLFGRETLSKWEDERYVGGLQGLPTNVILSFSDQDGLKNYFEKNIDQHDRIYYAGWFLLAEVSPLVDKVFYSLDRYLEIGQVNPEGGKSYLLLGPYQKGKFSIIGEKYHSRKVGELCDKIVYENRSYTLCRLRTNLTYENEAYE